MNRHLHHHYDTPICARQIWKAGRLRDLYEWGHITKEEYLAEHDAVRRQLRQLSGDDDKAEELSDLAVLLTSVSEAWDQAEREQRNGIAKTHFEEIPVEDGKVVAVRPRPELEPFFKLNLECHSRDITAAAEGTRGNMHYLSGGSLPSDAPAGVMVRWSGKAELESWPQLAEECRTRSLRQVAGDCGFGVRPLRERPGSHRIGSLQQCLMPSWSGRF